MYIHHIITKRIMYIMYISMEDKNEIYFLWFGTADAFGFAIPVLNSSITRLDTSIQLTETR